jgi:formylmethanofuran dehydrogenase subunit E
MRDFQSLLQTATERHGHLCAGQVLGVRLALRGLSELGIDPEREPKRLIVWVEIDRCAADAVATVTGCSLGKRTLKYLDYGKMAATFVDTQTDRAVRVVALDSARERAWTYAPAGLSKGAAQLAAYQAMPDAELFNLQWVHVAIPEFDRPGHPLRRVECVRCGEGINDGREIVRDGETLCRACANQAYYERVEMPMPMAIPLRAAAGRL